MENAIVTADAMSCQKTIVKRINKEKADYVIDLKGNQSTLLNDVTLYFKDFSDELPKYITKDKGHGRIEIREYQLLTDISWLDQKKEWENIQGVGIVNLIAISEQIKKL